MVEPRPTMEPYGPSPDRGQHERAVAAVQHLAERAPDDLWLFSQRADSQRATCEA